jgi:LmbE family N-acetylglucosaminyl deacetylase
MAIGAHPDDIELGCGGTLPLLSVSTLTISKGRNDPIDQHFTLENILPIIEQHIESIHPDVIYTHCSSDLNKDHRIVNEAVLIAARNQVKEIYAFDITSMWGYNQFGTFKPNVFVDITKMIEDKLKSLEKYQTEMRDYPHYRSPEKIRAVAEYWGRVINVQYAEAFELVRTIR